MDYFSDFAGAVITVHDWHVAVHEDELIAAIAIVIANEVLLNHFNSFEAI